MSQRTFTQVEVERMTEELHEFFKSSNELWAQMESGSEIEQKRVLQLAVERMLSPLEPEASPSVLATNDPDGLHRARERAESRRRKMGARIKAARVRAGMSQDDLARESGLNQGYVSRLESGKHLATIPTIEKVALALGISWRVLAGRDDGPEGGND